jgi:hypothetical protein
MRYLLILALIGTAHAQEKNWEITPEIRNECAKIGGCILTLPDGRLLPIAVVKEAMQEAYEEGKAQGKAEAENACVKKRV